MAQQINLCNPIFLTQKRYFSASTMARSLGVFVLLGGLLSGYWSWTLQSLSAGYQLSVNNNQREITRLQAAIQANRVNAAPADAAQVRDLQARQAELQQRELLLLELKRGLLREGYGHAARLQLVARSIPPQAWVTEIRADDLRLELSGYTQEPAALNGWVARLADSPLLEGQQLSVVKVERVVNDARSGTPAVVAAQAGAGPLWSYTLVTAVAPVAAGARP
ncbi:PilN domain-containing protein [Rhodoferax sp. BAB1]|uniref:PilN domain-containing protein n=1 Tax=Rhodoferax sp. BAB1 TaxID=2741720 RepID=UPI0015757DFF|nr:PilN domain-containing protein [Rhodoferax sp. BAB1]QKO22123.1 PilN domain-containing protein [Rhodoferax sp. BAB1]